MPKDIHKTNNLTISISEIDIKNLSLKNRLISRWKNRDELLDCINASCFLPIFGKYLYTTYRKKKCLDGTITYDYKDRIDTKDTLYIYPEKWRNDIKLTWYYCNCQNKWIEQLYKWGKEDAAKNKDMISKFLEK